MLRKGRFLWLYAGPARMFEGWEFGLLFLPRPDQTLEGEECRGAFRLRIRWSGRSGVSVLDGGSIFSQAWTGRELNWPPEITWGFG